MALLLSVESDGRMLILGGPTGEGRVTFMRYSVGFLLSVAFGTMVLRSLNICVRKVRSYIVWHPVAALNNVDTAAPSLDQENGSSESSSGVAVTPNFLSRAVTNSDGVGPSLFSALVDETRTSARSSRTSASASCSSGLCTGK